MDFSYLFGEDSGAGSFVPEFISSAHAAVAVSTAVSNEFDNLIPGGIDFCVVRAKIKANFSGPLAHFNNTNVANFNEIGYLSSPNTCGTPFETLGPNGP